MNFKLSSPHWHERGTKVLEAVRTVLRGQVYVSGKPPRGSSASCRTTAKRPFPPPPRYGVERLSDREFDVFQPLGQGLSAHEIGTRLHLCAKTLDAHRANIKRKPTIKTTPELISYAAQWNVRQTFVTEK